MKKTVICPVCGQPITIEFENSANNASEVIINHADACENPSISPRQRARLETLKEAKRSGILTGNFFAMENGGSIGTVKDGQAVALTDQELDEIERGLYANGYVKNTRLFRRFVLPQMMHALNYRTPDGSKTGFTPWLQSKGYEYSIKMVAEELRVIEKLRKSDPECYAERSRIFNKNVLVPMVKHDLEMLKQYVDGLATRRCRGRDYKRVHGKNLFVHEIEAKVFGPMKQCVLAIERANEKNLAHAAAVWMKKRTVLRAETPMAPEFVDAYKAAGAFYSLKNLILFHNCVAHNEDGSAMTLYESLDFVNAKTDACLAEGKGYKLLGYLKVFLEENHFDYIARLRELGVIAA